MAILAPDPNPVAVETEQVPALVRRSEDVERAILDQHAETRERIGDLLDAPSADTLSWARASVLDFLDVERQLVLLDRDHGGDLRFDARAVLRGRRAIRLALDRVTLTEDGASELARSVEGLRLAFLEHLDCYRRTATFERAPITLPTAVTTDDPGRTAPWT